MKRVACAYRLGSVPGWWLNLHRRLKAGVARHGLSVSVGLTPLAALPEDIDLLVVPPDLEREARQAGVAEVVAIGRARYAEAIAELVARLNDPSQFQIDRTGNSRSRPTVVKYVGYERVE